MFDLCGGFLVFVLLIMSAKPVGKNRLPAAEKKAVVERYITVCSHKNFRHRWMTAEHICEVIATEDPLDDSIDLNKNTFVDAMNNGQFKLLPMEEKNNNEGIYSNTVRPDKKSSIRCYQYRGKDHRGTPLGMYEPPVTAGKTWAESCLFDPYAETRAKNAEGGSAKKKARIESGADDDDNDGSDDDASAEEMEIDAPDIDPNADVVPPDMVLTDSEYDSDSDSDSDFEPDADDEDDDIFGVKELPPGTSIYYVSTEAKNIFCPRTGETAYDAIQECINICDAVHNSLVPYSFVIDGHDADDYMSDYAISKTRAKCYFIANALRERLDHCRSELDWRGCCKAAVMKLKKTGNKWANNADAVMGWYRQFRTERKFPNPSKGKAALPPFLQANPEAVLRIQAYGRENLSDLSSKLIMDYIHDTLIPKMMEKEKITSKAEYLKRYHLTKLCPRTVINWMHALGFRYEKQAKTYYTDGHEKVGTVRYRWKFIARYLLMEKRMHRWIQITKSEAMELAKEYPILTLVGYDYKDNTGQEMVEYHVDTINLFQERMKDNRFGGNLSVRKDANVRPLIAFGQDECIFKQYLFRAKAWKLNGVSNPMPKDEGYGLMISAFLSRVFGFGMEMTEDDLRRVNESREGKQYTDQDAAKVVNNCAMDFDGKFCKQVLNNSDDNDT